MNRKGKLEARDWKALGAALVATSRIQELRNYLKMRPDECSPQAGSEKNTFALSLSKGSSPPTHIVLRSFLSEGISQGRVPYLLLCGTRDEDHDLAMQAAAEFPNVSFRSLEGLDHHESRSRLDILIPIVKDFFGSGLNDAITRTE